MNRKQQIIYNANSNVNLMEENATKISGEITINVDVRVKKKIIFGIFLHVVATMKTFSKYYG